VIPARRPSDGWP